MHEGRSEVAGAGGSTLRHAGVLLGDLVASPDLLLEVLTAPEGWELRPVAGAHVVEIGEPTRWLLRDWVMITTGLRLGDDEAEQRRLVRELVNGGICALVYGTYDYQAVPRAIVEEADALGLPVLHAGERASFREIIRFVHEANASDVAQTFNRLAALHRFLLDAFGDPAPAPIIIERLANFLRVTVLVMDASGQTIHASHPVSEPEALLDAIVAAAGRTSTCAVTVGDVSVVAVTFPVDAGPPRWVLALRRTSSPLPELVKRGLQLAAPMLVATHRLTEAARAGQEAMRVALLRDLIHAGAGADFDELAGRAGSFGIAFDRPYRMLAVQSTDETSARCAELRAMLGAEGEPFLARAVDNGLEVLVREDHPLAAGLPTALGSLGSTLRIGVGRSVDTPSGVSVSMRDARLALRILVRRGRSGFLQYGELDLPSLFVSEASEERTAPRVARLLDELREHPALYETLQSYFDQQCDVRKAARRMQLHENTVRYRLSRIEEIVGSSLRNPATISALYLALVADAVALDS